MIHSVHASEYENISMTSDQYCFDKHIEPPRFAYYKYIRSQSHSNKWEYDGRITIDELDFYLKQQLKDAPEERYNHRKEGWEWHPSNMDGKHDNFNGCNNLRCISGCRFEAPYGSGRFEDEEVIVEDNEYREHLRQKGEIMDIALPDNWYELIKS